MRLALALLLQPRKLEIKQVIESGFTLEAVEPLQPGELNPTTDSMAYQAPAGVR
jgi:hypothetical protein